MIGARETAFEEHCANNRTDELVLKNSTVRFSKTHNECCFFSGRVAALKEVDACFKKRSDDIALVNAENDEGIYYDGQKPRPSVTKQADIRWHEHKELKKIIKERLESGE